MQQSTTLRTQFVDILAVVVGLAAGGGDAAAGVAVGRTEMTAAAPLTALIAGIGSSPSQTVAAHDGPVVSARLAPLRHVV